MLLKEGLTTEGLQAVFAEEVAIRRGKVTDTFNDGGRLYSRAVLPSVAEVRPGDRLSSGVAIKVTQEGVWLYPYTFRLVCSNGAILPQALDERPIADPQLRTPEAVLQAVRETIAACCKDDVFKNAVGDMRRSRELRAADAMLFVLSIPSRLHARAGQDVMSAVTERFRTERDPSSFGLANAITATARDVQDPELKWDLEKLGGAVALGMVRAAQEQGTSAESLLDSVDEGLVRTA